MVDHFLVRKQNEEKQVFGKAIEPEFSVFHTYWIRSSHLPFIEVQFSQSPEGGYSNSSWKFKECSFSNRMNILKYSYGF